MKTEDLISALSNDKPARPWIAAKPGFAVAIALAVLGAAITFFFVFGPRESFASSAIQRATAYKLLSTISIAGAATALLWQLRSPLAKGGLRLLALVFLAAVSAGIAMDQIAPVQGSFLERAIGLHPWLCLVLVPVMSAVPLALFISLMRLHAPGDPGRAGTVAGITAAAIGASFYALGCTNDSPLFVMIWYSLAGLIVTAAGYFAGRRLLSW